MPKFGFKYATRMKARRKTTTERAPVYHKDSKINRVISAPNGLWCAQIRVAEHGTREKDCWVSTHFPCEKSAAIAQMDYKYNA